MNIHTYAAFIKFSMEKFCVLIVEWQLLLILYCGFFFFPNDITFFKEKIMIVLTAELCSIRNDTCYKGR